MKVLRILWLVFLVFVVGTSSYGQTKNQLKNKKKKIQNDIDYINGLLKKNKAKQDASMNQITNISSKIESREELIKNYEDEMVMISGEIEMGEKKVDEMENQLKLLKESYSKMVIYAWKNRNGFSQWMYVLSAKNFNQGLRRYKYIHQINELRLVQAKSISGNQKELINRLGMLKASRDEKKILIAEKSDEVKLLEGEKQEKNDVVKKLKKKEKELLKKVKKQEAERDALTKKIDAIADVVNKDIKKDKPKNSNKTTTDKGNKTTTSTSKAPVTTSTGSADDNGFASNKGKLSWPVEKGVITGKFGVHPHPVLDKVEIKNDGIDISTDKGSSVKAVYKGTVSGVFKVDGYENVVIIRHGDYLTVYSHLSKVTVAKGDKVSTDQKIGTVATNDEGATFVNFQVRYGSEVQNPTGWLAK